jgi:hypothetical protein
MTFKFKMCDINEHYLIQIWVTLNSKLQHLVAISISIRMLMQVTVKSQQLDYRRVINIKSIALASPPTCLKHVRGKTTLRV